MIKTASIYLGLSFILLILYSFTTKTDKAEIQNPILFADSSYYPVNEIFKNDCIECHSGDDAPNGLRLTSYAELMKGSENGAVILAGDADGSELVKRIRGLSKPKMPLGGDNLPDEQINIIVDWINSGAKDDAEIPPLTEVEFVPKNPEKDMILFSDVAPIFKKNCMKCHMENGLMGNPPEGFMLTNYDEMFRGDERIRVVPGFPAASELLRRVNGKSFPQMPFDGPPYLNEKEITLIEAWIKQGAKDENGNSAPSVVGRKIRLEGILTSEWMLDDIKLSISNSTRIDKKISVGKRVKTRGVLGAGNEILVERIESD